MGNLNNKHLLRAAKLIAILHAKHAANASAANWHKLSRGFALEDAICYKLHLQHKLLSQVKALAPSSIEGRWANGHYVKAANLIKASFGLCTNNAIDEELCDIMEWCSLDCCYNGWE